MVKTISPKCIPSNLRFSLFLFHRLLCKNGVKQRLIPYGHCAILWTKGYGRRTNMALAGFQPYFVVPGSASLSFSRNGLGVSKAAVAKLCNSKFVRILIDKPGKRLAIQVCEENDPMATPFSKSDKPEGVRWNTKDLNQTILNMTGWTFDEKNSATRSREPTSRTRTARR